MKDEEDIEIKLRLLMWTLEVIFEPVMLLKLAPASVATAFASKVMPVPGGPNNKTPLQGCST